MKYTKAIIANKTTTRISSRYFFKNFILSINVYNLGAKIMQIEDKTKYKAKNYVFFVEKGVAIER